MNKYLSFLLIAALAAVSCGDKDKSFEGDDSVARCLMAKDYRYEELLTKADVSKHASIDEASFKMEISPTKGTYGSCRYQWNSDRPDIEIELLGVPISSPDRNFVVIKLLDFYTDDQLKLYSQPDALALFDTSYKPLTQSDYDKLLASLEKEYANDPSGLATAKKFLDSRMNLIYEPLAGLGDRAYWKWDVQHGLELVVLSGAARFTIETKLSSEAPASLESAVKFAREVLAKCGA